MNGTMIRLFTPKTKQASKQWVTKGTPGPVKAKRLESRNKRMVLSSFASFGLI